MPLVVAGELMVTQFGRQRPLASERLEHGTEFGQVTSLLLGLLVVFLKLRGIGNFEHPLVLVKGFKHIVDVRERPRDSSGGGVINGRKRLGIEA